MMNYKLLTFLLSVFLLASISADTIYDALGADNISSLFKDMEQRFAGIKNIPDKIGNLIGQKIIADNPRINLAAKTFKVLKGNENKVNLVAWSPDGTKLAYGSSDNTITIWNMTGDSPQLLQMLRNSRDRVASVVWSPDGTMLASVSKDAESPFYYKEGLRNTTINIWDTKTWQLIKTFDGAFIGRKSIAWSPDGKYFAWTSPGDKALKICDTESWELVKEFSGEQFSKTDDGNRFYSVAWSPDGKKLAADRNRGFITMWDTTSWEVLPLENNSFGVGDYGTQLIAWSPDSQLLAFYEYTNIRIFDVNSGKVIREFGHWRRDSHSVMCWSPDSNKFAYQIAFGASFDVLIVQNTTKWPRMHVTPREMAREIPPIFEIQEQGVGRFSSLGFNFNSSLFTAIIDKKVKMWDAKTGELVQEFEGDADISSYVWSPNGRQIAVVEGSIIKILNIALLDNKDIKNITLEQALLLKLLYAKNIALRYQWIREKRTNPDAKLVDSIDLASVHDKLLGSEAQRILSTFSDEARNRIIKRYNIVGYTSSPKREIDEDVETSSAQRHHSDSAVHQGAAASSSMNVPDAMEID